MLPSGFSSSFSPAFHSSFFHTVLGIVSPLARILRVLIEKVKPASSYRSNDSLNNDFHSNTSFSKILQNIAVSWVDKRFGNFWRALDTLWRDGDFSIRPSPSDRLVFVFSALMTSPGI